MKMIQKLCIAGTALCLIAGMCACDNDYDKLQKKIDGLKEKVKKEKETDTAEMPERKLEQELEQEPEQKPAQKPEVLTEVQREFNEKYAALMALKKSDPGKFEEGKIDFITNFSAVAQANGLTRAQLLQYNELAKELGLEVEVPEETVAQPQNATTDAKAAPGSDKQESKDYEAEYKKLIKYLNANTHPERKFKNNVKIMDELDKQLGMMREFMDKWESFPKTETEQKVYDNILQKYKKTQQIRDMYAM